MDGFDDSGEGPLDSARDGETLRAEADVRKSASTMPPERSRMHEKRFQKAAVLRRRQTHSVKTVRAFVIH